MDNKDYIITLQALLKGRDVEGFDKADPSTIKMVRHADDRMRKNNPEKKELLIGGVKPPSDITNLYDLYLYRRDLFKIYQSEQPKGIFDGINYLIVFLGERGTTARLLEIYKINNRTQNPIASDEEILDLSPVPGFEYLREKVIIDWGKSTVSWHQYYKQIKPVIRFEEGLLQSDGTPVFNGYANVLLDHSQLNMVMKDANWISKLKAVNCIYLITDKSNGKQYVGSTYNREGIYGRWIKYAENGHGGNVDLDNLIQTDPTYHTLRFQWSILETLAINITEVEAIERETIWKRKLQSIKFGYNNN